MNLEIITINNKDYQIIKLLGKGKGGYSFLVRNGDDKYVAKKIHHEPCDYYEFSDKLQSELNDYKRLNEVGILMPKLIDVDVDNEIILKEYIEGSTIFEMVKDDINVDRYIDIVNKMSKLLQQHDLNIDYFPTNFVVKDDELYYVDYECNKYMEKWNFINWGIKYWSKTKEFLDYLNK